MNVATQYAIVKIEQDEAVATVKRSVAETPFIEALNQRMDSASEKQWAEGVSLLKTRG